jgi:hypothetical protein
LIRIVEAVLDEDGALPNGIYSCLCETVKEGCRESSSRQSNNHIFFDEIGGVGNPTEIY